MAISMLVYGIYYGTSASILSQNALLTNSPPRQLPLRPNCRVTNRIAAHRQKQKLVAPPVEKKLTDEALAVVRQAVAPDAAAAAWATGATMTLDEAVTYVLAESVQTSS